MIRTSNFLQSARNIVALTAVVITLVACGTGNNETESRLRDQEPTRTGTLALQDQGDSSIVLIHLFSDHNDVGLCTGESSICLNPETPLLGLTKTAPGYWRSNAPVALSNNLVLHVIGIESGVRTVLLSAKLTSNAAGNGSQTTGDLPPPANLPKMRPIPNVPVAFDYHGTLSRDSSKAAVIRMIIQNGPLAQSKLVKVKGTLVNLRNSAVKIPLDRDVNVTNNVIDFTVAGLEPETVYRLEGTSVVDATTGKPNTSIGGPLRHQFHLATTADTKLSKAKRRAVLRAVAESYDWEYGNYQSSKGYANSGGWCDRFYTWAAAYDFKVSNVYSASSFFRQHNAIENASRIPQSAPAKSMAADMIRYEGTSEGTHTFMIIAYDVATKSLWTVEGNFNNRVMRLKRGVSSAWNHGFLVDSQAR